MTYQRVLAAVAIGSALAGIGFLLIHPSGKKFRRKAVDIGVDAADKLIDLLRSNLAQQEAERNIQQSERKPGYQPVHGM